MASACAPCVFGASSELLSLRNTIITVPVSTSTIIATGLNGSLSTRYETITLSGTPLPSGVQYVTDTTDITSRTLGTTFTYGTTYVHYLGFYGAAITSSATTCAESLQPSPLTTANANPASFVFVYQGSTGLPSQLLSYLDDSDGFLAQLNGDELEECSILQAPTPLGGAPATVTASTTSILTSRILSTFTTTVSGTSFPLIKSTPASTAEPSSLSSAVQSSSSEPSSEATTKTAVTETTLVATAITSVQAVSSTTPVISYSPIVLLQPVDVRAVGDASSSISATSIPEPEAVTLADSSSSSTTSLPISESSSETTSSSTPSESSVDLGDLFSAIAGASLTSADTASSTSTMMTTSSSQFQASEDQTTSPTMSATLSSQAQASEDSTSVETVASSTTAMSTVSSSQAPASEDSTVGTVPSSPTANSTSPTSTSSLVSYTGGASRPLARVEKMINVQWLVGLALPLLL